MLKPAYHLPLFRATIAYGALQIRVLPHWLHIIDCELNPCYGSILPKIDTAPDWYFLELPCLTSRIVCSDSLCMN